MKQEEDSIPLPREAGDDADLQPAAAGCSGRKPAAPPDAAMPINARLLRRLSEEQGLAEAGKLAAGIDFAADQPPDLLYHAAIGLGALGRHDDAVALLQRAAADGYSRFYCGFHLGLFEAKRGNAAAAAHYFAACLIVNPARDDMLVHLEALVPDLDLAALRAAQGSGGAPAEPAEAFALGAAKQRLGKAAAAACYFTMALALDPANAEARARLLQAAPSISLDVLIGIEMDRLAERLREVLSPPAAGGADLARQLGWAEAVFEIYANNQHPSGHALIPALEAVLHRALAARQIDLDALCDFYDRLQFLHWYTAADFNAMRGLEAGVMRPCAAAIRDGWVRGLAAITPRALGAAPLRLGYLSQFATLGNPIGPCAHAVLGGLSRHLPGKYHLFLYAWSEHDDASAAALDGTGVLVRRFSEPSMRDRIAAVANAIAADEIDILITDMNTALPTVLFERRVAPVQIFFEVAIPFWPIANLDGVLHIDPFEPEWNAFPPEKCFPTSLGPWHRADYAPPVAPCRIAAERARLPPAEKLVGTYVRFAKVTRDFLEVAAALIARHPQLVVAIGGTGDGKWIREFIESRSLADRLVLIGSYVDGHAWGHMLDVFLDTFPIPGGVAGREVMAKGRPVVTMRMPWVEIDRVPMLTADDVAGYVDIVSRLLEDPAYYEAACAATREFIDSQPSEAEYIAGIDETLRRLVARCEPASSAAPGDPSGSRISPAVQSSSMEEDPPGAANASQAMDEPQSHVVLFNDERYQRCNLRPGQHLFRHQHRVGTRIAATLSGVVDGDLLDCGHSAPFGGIDWARQREPASAATDLLQAVAERARNAGLRAVRIRARPAYYGANESAVEFALHNLGAAVERCELSLAIETARFRHPDDYVAALRSPARNRLRHGLQAMLPCGLADDDADWAACYALLAETKRRRGAAMKITLDYLLGLRALFGPRIAMHRLTRGGAPVAAALVYRVAPQWDYLVAWGDHADFRLIPLMNVLAYHLVCRSIADQVSLLDLGISSVNGVADDDLVQFKRSIGASTGLRIDFRLAVA